METPEKQLIDIAIKMQAKFGNSVSTQLEIWKHPDKEPKLCYTLWLGHLPTKLGHAIVCKGLGEFVKKAEEILREETPNDFDS